MGKRIKKGVEKMTNFGVLFYPETKTEHVLDFQRGKNLSGVLDEIYLLLGVEPLNENVFYYNELEEESNRIGVSLGDMMSGNGDYEAEFLLLIDLTDSIEPITVFIRNSNIEDNEKVAYIDSTQYTYDNGNSVVYSRTYKTGQGQFDLIPNRVSGTDFFLNSKIKIIKISNNKILFNTETTIYFKATSNRSDMIQIHDLRGFKIVEENSEYSITDDLLLELNGGAPFPIGTKLIGYKTINQAH